MGAREAAARCRARPGSGRRHRQRAPRCSQQAPPPLLNAALVKVYQRYSKDLYTLPCLLRYSIYQFSPYVGIFTIKVRVR